MGFFDNTRRLFQSKPKVPLTPSEQMHPWDNRMRLIDLTDAAGSSKTSSLAMLASWMMELECGFVWQCAKPNEVNLVRKIARSAGREEDVIVIGEDVDGEVTSHCFIPIEYETSISTTGTGAVVTYLSDCAKVLSRKDGDRSGGEGERFWNDQFERLLRHCIDTAKLSGRPLSVDLLRRIQLSARPVSCNWRMIPGPHPGMTFNVDMMVEKTEVANFLYAQ